VGRPLWREDGYTEQKSALLLMFNSGADQMENIASPHRKQLAVPLMFRILGTASTVAIWPWGPPGLSMRYHAGPSQYVMPPVQWKLRYPILRDHVVILRIFDPPNGYLSWPSDLTDWPSLLICCLISCLVSIPLTNIVYHRHHCKSSS
jgi:hypothetical protein